MSDATDEQLKEILSNLFADGRSIGHQRAVTADEWGKYVGEATQAIEALIKTRELQLLKEVEGSVMGAIDKTNISDYEAVSDEGDETWFEYIDVDDFNKTRTQIIKSIKEVREEL